MTTTITGNVKPYLIAPSPEATTNTTDPSKYHSSLVPWIILCILAGLGLLFLPLLFYVLCLNDCRSQARSKALCEAPRSQPRSEVSQQRYSSRVFVDDSQLMFDPEWHRDFEKQERESSGDGLSSIGVTKIGSNFKKEYGVLGLNPQHSRDLRKQSGQRDLRHYFTSNRPVPPPKSPVPSSNPDDTCPPSLFSEKKKWLKPGLALYEHGEGYFEMIKVPEMPPAAFAKGVVQRVDSPIAGYSEKDRMPRLY